MYNNIVINNFSNPLYAGEIENPHIELEVGNSVCGDRIRIQIEVETDSIARVVFQAWGCATSVATANIFCSLIHDKSIDTVLNCEQNKLDNLLGTLEPSQQHCLDILHDLHKQLQVSLTSSIGKIKQA